MKNILQIIFTLSLFCLNAQLQHQNDSTKVYKKRVLSNVEIDVLSSYYKQDGNNAAVTGGIGIEQLDDIATSITVAIPLNDDDVFTVDATISAYTSASSSNIDPFSGASSGNDDDDDYYYNISRRTIGSPWTASSGASQSDIWASGVFSFSHSSDDRNKVWSANLNTSIEYDYFSFGFGGSHTWLFNQKNTEFGITGNVYLDKWNPIYPTEIDSFIEVQGNLNEGFFENVEILDQGGNVTNPNDVLNTWSPVSKKLIENKNRNTFAVSLKLAQILNKKAQFSVFLDVVQQKGWLANPSQRVYFKDIDNYYIGEGGSINNYESPTNATVFQLADDIERLPETRFKLPVGFRFNYYINEYFILKTYYRYYADDWGINAHTAEIELPIKLSNKFTLYPSCRYYKQTKSDYFAPYELHHSKENFYTSDYDLSNFNSSQYSFGVRYTDIFTKTHIWKFNLKQVDLKYSHYQRNINFKSGIISLGFKYIFK